jgi:hypothetical protein
MSLDYPWNHLHLRIYNLNGRVGILRCENIESSLPLRINAPRTSNSIYPTASKRKISCSAQNGSVIRYARDDNLRGDAYPKLPKTRQPEKTQLLRVSQEKQGLCKARCDTLTFWVMETVEIAASRPYHGPRTRLETIQVSEDVPNRTKTTPSGASP